jgi:uncharacterized protein
VSSPTRVTRSRFEVEQDGKTSYLEFETDGQGWLTLLHTEVAKEQRGQGIALELVTAAFEYAREHSLKVDLICPVAHHIVGTHPEFQALVGRR